jgi:hypothetical protein
MGALEKKLILLLTEDSVGCARGLAYLLGFLA